MPSILSINNVAAEDVFSTSPSRDSILFSSEIRRVIESTNLGNFLAPTSIPNSKLIAIEGNTVAQTTLSGYSSFTNPGQIAYKTITSYNIARNAVKGPEGGVPVGTVIFYYGRPTSEGGTLPEGYMVANGAFLNVAAYSELFQAIEYRFGNDGSGRFRLPTIAAPLSATALIKI